MPEPATAELLLEIGCEEMPAPWLPGLREQLAQRFREAAEREHLKPSGVRSSGTPRRFALRADVLTRQLDRDEEIWGPPLKIAKDTAGQWTRAAEGFAKKCGVSVDQLQIAVRGSRGIVGGMPAAPLTEPSESYLLYVRKLVGRAASDVMADLIAETLRSLTFPKRMSWDAWLDDGKGAFPFGRPIRWLVALLGGKVVPFTIYALENGAKGRPIVESGDTTVGHRFLPRDAAARALRVGSYAELEARLAEAFVLIDPEKRENRIREGLAAGAGTAPKDDHGLVREWRDLVEYPTVVFGRIPAEFRVLPKEVLETVLVHHQKYIPLSDGGAVTRFAAVTNTDARFAEAMVRGMERVVVARLRDAVFFFGEDRKRPLADRVADLAGVTFHQGLGTYADKAARLTRLVDAMGADLGVLTKPEHDAAREAARLAKADLTTFMVREFPELQGVMGGIYLTAQGGQMDGVARAVRWHYHPVSVEEETAPRGAVEGSDATIFGAVSLADKLDSLAGYFGLGLTPKGSSDPFALRRAGHGVIRVLLDFWHSAENEARPDLNELIAIAVDGYGKLFEKDRDRVIGTLKLFFLDRIDYVFQARGYPADEVAACMSAEDPAGSPLFDSQSKRIKALGDVRECFMRLKALHRVRTDAREDFDHLASAFKRANNILVQAKSAGWHPSGVLWSDDVEDFPEGPERNLFSALEQTRTWGTNVRGLPHTEKWFEQTLRSLAGIRPAVDAFFDGVMVMDSDPEVRRRRLELMNITVVPFYRIADISKLGGQA